MVEGSDVARVGYRRPCPVGRECGYRAAVLRTGTGCEYVGFLCAGEAPDGPCRPAGPPGGRAWLGRRRRPRPAPAGV